MGPLLVFIVIGGLGLFLLSKRAQTKLQDPVIPVPALQTRSTEAALLLAFANPRATQDELLRLQLPHGPSSALTVPKGWRASSLPRHGMRVELLADAETYRLVREDGWNVALRSPAGVSYKDPVLVGFFDADHIGVVAHTDTRVLLDVSRFGEIRVLQVLQDEASVRLVQGGAAWVTTFTPGEGIESEPQGPSTLTRLTRTGASTTKAESPGVISRVVPFSDRSDIFAYGTEQGTFTAMSGTTSWQGTGVPLVWTTENELIFTQDNKMWRRDVTSSTKEELVFLQKIPVTAVVSSTERVLW